MTALEQARAIVANTPVIRTPLQQAEAFATSLHRAAEFEAKAAQIEAHNRQIDAARNFHTVAGWWNLAITSNSEVHISLIPAPVGFTAKTWTTGGKRGESGQRIMFPNADKTVRFPSGDVL